MSHDCHTPTGSLCPIHSLCPLLSEWSCGQEFPWPRLPGREGGSCSSGPQTAGRSLLSSKLFQMVCLAHKLFSFLFSTAILIEDISPNNPYDVQGGGEVGMNLIEFTTHTHTPSPTAPSTHAHTHTASRGWSDSPPCRVLPQGCQLRPLP